MLKNIWMNNPMASKKILTIVGARPQFIKAAAISRAFKAHGDITEYIIHTGQHYDANMSDIFFEELGIPTPRHHLSLGGGTHGQMTGRMLEALEKIFIDEKPDAILIYGDTNSTLAGALAAVKIHIPVIHVEAGLRSFNRKMPEEINRILSDQVSKLLLCPTQVSIDNLKTEGITKGVHMVGDVMHDATLFAIEKTKDSNGILETLGIAGKSFAVCTMHRAENTDNPERFDRLITFLEDQAKQHTIIFAVHPRTRNLMADRGIAPKGVQLIDPVGYFDLHTLLQHCELVLTDSGGLQKEAYFHRKPCITMRDETEWVETIETGWNRLWTSKDWVGTREEIADYGKGDAAQKCAKIIHSFLG